MVTDRKQIPSSTVERLSQYYREIDRLHGSRRQIVSSSTLADILHLKPTQVRKDLAYFGEFGRRGIGYSVAELHGQLRTILGLDLMWSIGLMGVGNLGAALLSYKPFQSQGFNISAAFDSNPKLVGKEIKGVTVHSIRRLKSVSRRFGLNMAMLAVPAPVAQKVADKAVKAGIHGIVNFAPVKLSVPEGVMVRQVDMTVQLKVLAYHLRSLIGD